MDWDLEWLEPPLSDRQCAEVAGFLQHKGWPWIDDIRRRLAGDMPGAADAFLLARAEGIVVAHLWYGTARGWPEIGALGHVYTSPSMRRRGIADDLMLHALVRFQEQGGQLMQLFTSTPYTLPWYQRHGFRSTFSAPVYHECDWYLYRSQALRNPTADVWWSGGTESIDSHHGGDLAAWCLLYNLEYQTHLKDWAQRIGTGLEAEYAFIETWRGAHAGRTICRVIRAGPVIRGVATVTGSRFPHQCHLARCDCYAPRAPASERDQLLDQTVAAATDAGVEQLTALAVDNGKQTLFSRHGFIPVAENDSAYRVGDQSYVGTWMWRQLGG